MKTLVVYLLLTMPAFANVDEARLRGIQFEQRVNQHVSGGITMRDENGKEVTLGSYFGKKPVILVPGYYGCPMLCNLVLNGLVEALRNLRLTAGKDYELICYSIEPTEQPALAAAKRRSYLRNYGRDGADWHFLTGSREASSQLSREIGFEYVYDPATRQYAHPSGFVVLSPDGRILRYFFGVDFPSREIDQALTNACSGGRGVTVTQLFLLCFHYNPIRGKYGPLIMNSVRAGGLLCMTALAVMIVKSTRRPGRS